VNKKVKILFTAAFSTSFIREDISFLRSQYLLQEIISSGILTFVKIITALPSSTVTFSWFASVYSSVLVFLTKVFRNKSIIVLGGVDVANIPELNYGIWNSWWKSRIVRYGIMHADAVLAVDESLKQDAIRLARYDGGNIHVVATGYDPDRWKPGKTKENIILTVAQCDSHTRVKIKGIDFLFNIAAAMPEQSFVLIGLNRKIADQYTIPSNLSIVEFVPQPELLAYYQKAVVYLQPSLREGLPNTVCEAMLCECYPIGTNVGGIPTAIGTSGSVIRYGNIDEAKKAILDGLDHGNNAAARKRIATHFTKQMREQQLSSHIEALINAK
jgi:glycosyltransferase involved in cell wall biosynthesis